LKDKTNPFTDPSVYSLARQSGFIRRSKSPDPARRRFEHLRSRHINVRERVEAFVPKKWKEGGHAPYVLAAVGPEAKAKKFF
jgi:hypothetical protein